MTSSSPVPSSTQAPALPADEDAPAPSPPAPETDIAPAAFHRLPCILLHRRYWFRPLVVVGVAAVSYAVMVLALIVGMLLLSLAVPGAEPSVELEDPLNPMDQMFVLGMLALMLPAVLLGTLAGHGRAGIAHSVLGRFRWGLLGRAATVIVPLYLVVNLGVSLVAGREQIVVPPPEAGVLVAWSLLLLLTPLQAAAEEYAFRVLPMQVMGTWLRSPLPGILLPIPLFVLGHEYALLGQIDIALFALCMGLLTWKTGGIEIPVLLHVANNWTLFAITPLLPHLAEQGEVTWTGFLLAALPTLLCTVGTWWWVSQREGVGLWEPVRGTASVSPGVA